jgi:CelD/BcsL family acetyltransferase involved in cellulose biosynthesis
MLASVEVVPPKRSSKAARRWVCNAIANLASSPYDSCRGVMSTLYAGETWVASHFGLRNNSQMAYYFPVYNPALSRYSPGHLLLKALIDSAHRFGITAIEFGRGDNPYKLRFGNRTRSFYRGLWQSRGLRAIAHRLSLSIEWRLSAGAR